MAVRCFSDTATLVVHTAYHCHITGPVDNLYLHSIYVVGTLSCTGGWWLVVVRGVLSAFSVAQCSLARGQLLCIALQDTHSSDFRLAERTVGRMVVCYFRRCVHRSSRYIYLVSRRKLRPHHPCKVPNTSADCASRVHDCVCAACLSILGLVPSKHGIVESRLMISFGPSCHLIIEPSWPSLRFVVGQYHHNVLRTRSSCNEAPSSH